MRGEQSPAWQSLRITGLGHSGSWLKLPEVSMRVCSPSCGTQKSSEEKMKTTPH